MIKPCYQDAFVTLYLGDCLEVLPQIKEQVDLVLSDPPYGINYVTNHRKDGDKLAKAISGDMTLTSLQKALRLLDLLLKFDRHAYLFMNPLNLWQAHSLVSQIWQIKNILCWDKGDAGTVGDLTGDFGRCWEAVIFAVKGRRLLNGPRPRNVVRYDWSTNRDPVHPTVKPTPVLRKLIEISTNVGELVIDPFAGSGTTLRAAKDLGRRAIGIEYDPSYVNVAINRLKLVKADHSEQSLQAVMSFD